LTAKNRGMQTDNVPDERFVRDDFFRKPPPAFQATFDNLLMKSSVATVAPSGTQRES
jgi:hypothetical protein